MQKLSQAMSGFPKNGAEAISFRKRENLNNQETRAYLSHEWGQQGLNPSTFLLHSPSKFSLAGGLATSESQAGPGLPARCSAGPSCDATRKTKGFISNTCFFSI